MKKKRSFQVSGFRVQTALLLLVTCSAILVTSAFADNTNVINPVNRPVNVHETGAPGLPGGAATAAKQDTGNTSLASIDGKLPASPATAANQATANTSLGTIVTNTGTTATNTGTTATNTGNAVTNQTNGTAKTQMVDAAGTVQPIANVFKNFNTTSSSAETTIWTPAAGKKFRLLGFVVYSSANTTYSFRDNTAGTVIWRDGSAVTNRISSPPMGAGILSSAANNVLTLTSSASSSLNGTVWGTEE